MAERKRVARRQPLAMYRVCYLFTLLISFFLFFLWQTADGCIHQLIPSQRFKHFSWWRAVAKHSTNRNASLPILFSRELLFCYLGGLMQLRYVHSTKHVDTAIMRQNWRIMHGASLAWKRTLPSIFERNTRRDDKEKLQVTDGSETTRDDVTDPRQEMVKLQQVSNR